MTIPETNRIVQKKLGRILVTEGLIKEEDLSAVLEEQAKDATPRPVGTLLVEMGYASEQDIVRAPFDAGPGFSRGLCSGFRPMGGVHKATGSP